MEIDTSNAPAGATLLIIRTNLKAPAASRALLTRLSALQFTGTTATDGTIRTQLQEVSNMILELRFRVRDGEIAGSARWRAADSQSPDLIEARAGGGRGRRVFEILGVVLGGVEHTSHAYE